MRRVLVQFLDFQLEYHYDVLYVGTIRHPRALTHTGYLGNDTRIISPINESLLLEFTTDESVTYQGFSLLVTDVADGDYALCQIMFDIITCYESVNCPKEETQLSLNESITIQSPGYPLHYGNNIGCEWTVTPSAMRRAHVQFLYFQLEDDHDLLYIGTIMNPWALTYTGYIGYDTRIISPINEGLLFEFTTDGETTDQGFSLIITDVEDGAYALCKNGFELITESFNCYDCPDEKTQLSLNASVTIKSPGYPATYLNNIGCEWTVTPSAMRRLLVQFLDFQIENGYDLLHVGTINNPRTLTYSGRLGYETSDARIISPVNEGLSFEFTTDDAVTYQGFSILVTDVEDGDYALCQNGLEIIRKSYICYENDCPNKETQLSLNASVTIHSPGYPKHYSNNIRCEWTVTPSAMMRVQLQFLDFRLEHGRDILYVGTINFPRALIYSGNDTADARIISPINGGLLFEFVTDFSITDQGFALLVADVIDGESTCGLRTIFLANSTTMASPGFPDPYSSDLDCQWVIIADNKKYESLILARLQFFELENGFDYLAVGNGRVARKNAIAELTGVLKVRTITSSTSSMWFALKTDSTGNKLGYRLELEHIRVSAVGGVCTVDEYHCGSGFCVTSDAECDGFVDCYVNKADENRCAYITCPGSYLCDEVPDVNISKCVTMDEVCDGQIGCPGGDDEIKCDIKRCPEECNCAYNGNNLQIDCSEGWSMKTIKNMARTVNTLKFTGGIVSDVEPGLFKGLFALHTLSLANNGIGRLQQGAFDGLTNLTWLDLSRNNISRVKSHGFRGLPQLKELYLSYVPISTIQTDAFNETTKLEILVLIRESEMNIPVDVEKGGFNGLNSLKKLYVDDRFLCCHFDSLEECVSLEPQPPLFMCGSLMQNIVLRVSMWILGISALIGNVFVVAVRVKEKTTSAIQAKQSFLIGNLAVSDCLMGIYMLVLASADLYYGDEYFIYSDQWRSSKLCKLASFLSLLSSEASVFFITLISIDRFFCVVFPFGKFRLRNMSIKVAASLIWVIAFVVGLVPTLQAGPESDFYDLSDVCIGLPLITRPSSYIIQSNDVGGPDSGRSFDIPVPDKFKSAWYYSIAIFLGINLFCFLVISVCYTTMFIKVKVSGKRAQSEQNDIKIAIRMAAIVGTDFICWMPVIIMGILSQTGAAVIPLQMYTWCVVFILPINSSINPYLYTIVSLIGDARNSNIKRTRVSTTRLLRVSVLRKQLSESNV
ncbi:uncharacterized protein [Amphiura filiformis]|uniref:uncharacterized protein n=1 Tax=Amphiura filiformis TaxID=82378 RepID=UPI003B213B12